MTSLGLGRGLAIANPNYRLDAGSVLSRTVSVWAQNLFSFCLVGFVAYLPVFLLIGALAATDNFQPGMEQLVELATKLFGLVLTGAVTYGVFRHLHGDRAEAGEVLRVGLSRFWPVLLTAIVVGLATTLGFCLLIVPGILLLVRFWVAVPVVVIESSGISVALSRSETLTEGNRLTIFGLALLMGVILFVGVMALGIGAVLLTNSPGPLHTWGAVPMGPVAQALVALLSIPLQTLAAVGPAVAYHDLRVGKEGADVEELLRVFE